MNKSDISDNNSNDIFSTTIISSTRRYYSESPFNSWYLGGVLFLFTFIFGLVCANYYRKNCLQLMWMRLLTQIYNTLRRSSSSIESSTDRTVEPVLV